MCEFIEKISTEYCVVSALEEKSKNDVSVLFSTIGRLLTTLADN